MEAIHPLANPHLPVFVAPPGGSDWLMTVMLVFLLVSVLSVGLFYLKLHALPEHMAHRGQKVQLQFVAVLGLLALFTHNHLFWVAALLIALVDLPDFWTPLDSMARSLRRLAQQGAPGPKRGRYPAPNHSSNRSSNHSPNPAPDREA